MSDNKLARLLTDLLPPGSPTLFNPWRDHCTDDVPRNGPDAKLARLAAHLDCSPKFILCGEAAGYQGCRHSGIAFTSERLLGEGKIPRIPRTSHRLTNRRLPYSEPSATIVWHTLYELGIEDRTILWNALPMHPHRRGERHSNRKPNHEEVEKGKRALRMLVDEFPSARVVAVGRTAERLLESMGVAAEYVRHPANAGATKFRQRLKRLVSG